MGCADSDMIPDPNNLPKKVFILDEKELSLIETKTKLSKEDILQWYTAILTDHPDGYIKLAEFSQIYTKLYPFGNSEKYAKIAFQAFDKEKTGKISLSHFLLATSFALNNKGGENLKGSLEFIFDLYDSDQNGKIGKKEMEVLMVALLNTEGFDTAMSKKIVEKIFQIYDLDKNDYLDKTEFVYFMTSDKFISKIFS